MARTDNLTNYLTDVAQAIKGKKGDNTPILAKNFDKEIENLITGGVAPMNITNLEIKSGDKKVNLTWSDPDDSYDKDGLLLAKWIGTKVVYNTQHYPKSYKDGILAFDSKIRNAYKTENLTIKNLFNDTTYYFRLFPYSDEDVYNNETNEGKAYPVELPTPEQAPFDTATNSQISRILKAYYDGFIDINDYWHIGDTRVMHLSAMPATPPYASESHSEQDMTMIIIGIEHDDLLTPINGITKSAITLQCKESLGHNGNAEYTPIWGTVTSTSVSSNYSTNPRRTWLNSTFINSLPAEIQPLIKTVIKKNIADHKTAATAGPNTEDKAFFTSYPEMFGSAKYGTYMGSEELEGKQYPYYNSDDRRIKYINNNGIAYKDSYRYFLRSPNSGASDSWMQVSDKGTATANSSQYTGCGAPAFCL